MWFAVPLPEPANVTCAGLAFAKSIRSCSELKSLSAFTTIGRAQGIDAFRFEVTTLGGQTLTQEDFRDSVLLVDFWGTWCGPCVGAVPVLQEMYAKYKHHGLEIVGLTYESGDQDKAAAKVRELSELGR